jgi:hypothetical protein
LDRALSAELIRHALGEHVALPDPNELRRLMARAEAALVAGPIEVPPELLASGWYLHAIASVSGDDFVAPVRRRQAFQVSAHIFDLGLRQESVPDQDRLRMAFAAEAGYLYGELNPNAVAIYRQLVAPHDLPSMVEDPSRVALHMGCALLAFDTGWLFPALRRLRDDIIALEEQWAVSFDTTVFEPAVMVVDAVAAMVDFLTRGSAGRLEAARQYLLRAVRSTRGPGDIDSRWVASHLLDLSGPIEAGSVWRGLPPTVPDGVRRAIALASPPVLTLWPPQLEISRAGDRSPFSPDVKRVLLSLPTSAGKTLLSQVIVATELATRPRGVAFVAPTRSLCREVRQALRGRLRFLARQHITAMSDWIYVDVWDDETPDVEVMTPERLAYLMREDADAVLARFGMFIFDEAHALGDKERGWTLESLITHLNVLTAETDHRIALMSAAVGNRAHLMTWIDPTESGYTSHSEWRGPRRLLAIFTTERDRNRSEPLAPSRSGNRRTSEPLLARLAVRAGGNDHIYPLTLSRPVGTLVTEHTPRGETRVGRLSTPFYRCLAAMLVPLVRAGSMLVITPTRIDSVRMAQAMAEGLPPVARTSRLREVVENRLGRGHRLLDCLAHGVAYHHSSIPSDVLAEIEHEFRTGALDAVVSTTTLAEGVNLPVRTVVITAQGTYAQGGDYHEYITGSRLVNAIGRAGRAARETEGWVILGRQARYSVDDFRRLNPTDEDLAVMSSLLDHEALRGAAEFDDLVRRAADADIEDARELTAAVAAYVWVVLERAGPADEPAALRLADTFLQQTLGWSQMDEGGRSVWRRVVAASGRAYWRTDPGRRTRWTRSGLSLRSARLLDAFVTALIDRIDATVEGALPLADVLAVLSAAGGVATLINLDEAPRVRIRTTRGGPTELVVPDLDRLLGDWIRGSSIESLASDHLEAVLDASHRVEQMSELLTDVFENFCSWILGIAVAWSNQALEARGSRARLPESLPAFIHHGVSSRAAVSLLRGGLPSRGLAVRIADAYAAAETQLPSVREWLASLDLVEVVQMFSPSAAELRALLDFTRRPGAGLVAGVLDGQSVLFPMRLTVAAAEGTSVVLGLQQGVGPALGVYVDDQEIGSISTEHIADLAALVETGVPLETTLRLVDQNAFVRVVLMSESWERPEAGPRTFEDELFEETGLTTSEL